MGLSCRSCCYLRRLASEDVLKASVEDGARGTDYFAYADGFDGKRYLGLRLGDRPMVDMHGGLVVRREKALEQLAFDGGDDTPSVANPPVRHDGGNGDAPVPPVIDMPKAREVTIQASLDRLTAGSQVGGIVEEVLQRLYDIPGCNAELTFDAFIEVPGGIDDVTLCTIMENANTLGITLRTE